MAVVWLLLVKGLILLRAKWCLYVRTEWELFHSASLSVRGNERQLRRSEILLTHIKNEKNKNKNVHVYFFRFAIYCLRCLVATYSLTKFWRGWLVTATDSALISHPMTWHFQFSRDANNRKSFAASTCTSNQAPFFAPLTAVVLPWHKHVDGSRNKCGLKIENVSSPMKWAQGITRIPAGACGGVYGVQRQLRDYGALEKMRKDEQTNK